MSEAPQKWGVTPPISLNPPSPQEIDANTKLTEALIAQGSFESAEESARREIVLGQIATLVKKFVHKVLIARGHSEAAARNAGGKIFTFGSYRLGVHGPGSDIDTLCVVPKSITREDFFTYFEPMLREFEGATDVSGVPDAYVPIITAVVNGVAIDLLFARLGLSSIPDDLDLQDNNLLLNLDERCVRSLGGSRVTDQMLRLVPDVEVFRLALRCVKLWAQSRAIYSNVMGFLGGVAWAMLVARICQLYPNANAAQIINRFFKIYLQWKWPSPVILTPIVEGPLQVRVWNPKLYPSDRAHRMPIITPAYPSMCSTHNVAQSQLSIMTTEFGRGHKLVEEIMFGREQWSKLWEKYDFYYQYNNYLQVVASTRDHDAYLKWSGKVESQVRQLVSKLEFVEGVATAHPGTKAVERLCYCKDERQLEQITMGRFTLEVLNQKLEDIEGEERSCTVYVSSWYIGLGLKPKQPGQPSGRKLDISYPTTEFVKQLKTWEYFSPSSMAIVVGHVKSSELPDDLLDKGKREATTTKTKRKKKSDQEDGENGNVTKKRRSSAAVGETVNPAPLTAQRKAAQQSDGLLSAGVPQPNTTLSPMTNSNGSLPTAADEKTIGMTAAASITDANLAAAVLEATSIKSPTPAPGPTQNLAAISTNGVPS